MLEATVLSIIFAFRNSAYFAHSVCISYYSDINSFIWLGFLL